MLVVTENVGHVDAYYGFIQMARVQRVKNNSKISVAQSTSIQTYLDIVVPVVIAKENKHV